MEVALRSQSYLLGRYSQMLRPICLLSDKERVGRHSTSSVRQALLLHPSQTVYGPDLRWDSLAISLDRRTDQAAPRKQFPNCSGKLNTRLHYREFGAVSHQTPRQSTPKNPQKSSFGWQEDESSE